jgi:two-component system sensor histidine kinase/response regulator
MIADLTAALPDDEAIEQGETDVDWDALSDTVAQLETLLADDDAEASDLFLQHAVAMRAAFGPATVPIENALREYDFETALEALLAAKADSPLAE